MSPRTSSVSAKKMKGSKPAYISIFKDLTASPKLEERRKSARLPAELKTRFEAFGGAVFRETVTKNISIGGCLLVSDCDLPIGSKLSLIVELGRVKILVNGTVKRLAMSHRDRFEFGVEFEEMSSDTRRVFADYCFEKMYEATGLSL